MAQRYLDDMEARLIRYAPAFGAEYRGVLDESAYAQAFDVVCRHYAATRAAISRDRRGYVLIGERGQPEFVSVGRDQFESALWGSWDNSVALARLVVGSDADGGITALRMSHAVVDGRALNTIMYEVWSTYVDLVAGRKPVQAAPVPLPTPPFDLLSQRLQIANRAPSPQVSTAAIHVDSCEIVQPLLRLTAAETSGLVDTAKSVGLSVHSILCGSVLTAQRDFAEDLNGSARMFCWAAVDLRDRVSPPVSATETSMFVTMHRADVEVDRADDMMRVAKLVADQVDEALADPRKLSADMSGMLELDTESRLGQQLANTGVSNYGRLAVIPNAEGLQIANFRTMVNVYPPVSPGYSVYTYGGRLNLQCRFRSDTFSSSQIDRLTTDIVTRLRTIAGHGV
nr:hypothetical protein [Jiangella mangrovi]